MSDQLEFKVIDRVVAQGEKRLKSMFRSTLNDLEKARQQDLSPEQEAQLDEVVEAYKLTENLVLTLVQVKDNIQLRLGH